jgi:hypothetical protein
MPAIVWTTAVFLVIAASGPSPQPERERWIAITKADYAVPAGREPVDVLVEMNALLASPDPVLRDDVAFTTAERWIRAGRVPPAGLRQLMTLWLANMSDGLGASGDDRIFKRSFSALALSLVAARDLAEPFLEPAELQMFWSRMLEYFAKERDLRGFDPVHGWMHSVAHTSDTLKFLARNPRLAAGQDIQLLAALRNKIESADAVFVWGENDRMALALQSMVRRQDANPAAFEAWTDAWVAEHKALWAGGPQVDASRFVRLENAKQVLRSLHTALTMEAKPTPSGDKARQTVLAALSRMR